MRRHPKIAVANEGEMICEKEERFANGESVFEHEENRSKGENHDFNNTSIKRTLACFNNLKNLIN